MIYPSKNVVVPDVKPVVFHRVGNCERVKCQFKYPPNCTKPTISQYKYDFSKKTRTKSRRPINYCNHKNAFHIYRYDSPSHVKEFLETGTMAFIRPSKWTDKFERLFYKPHIEIGQNNYDIVCLCFKYDWIVGEEAAWERYGEKTPPVRVEFNFQTIVNILNNYAVNNCIDFYISIIDYSLRRSQIIKLYQDKKEFDTIEEYLTYLSIKRDAFSHENEIRVFAVSEGEPFEELSNGVIKFELLPKNGENVSPHKLLHYVAEDNDDNGKALITEITLPPKEESYNEINNLIETIKRIAPSFTMNSSKLYNTSFNV